MGISSSQPESIKIVLPYEHYEVYKNQILGDFPFVLFRCYILIRTVKSPVDSSRLRGYVVDSCLSPVRTGWQHTAESKFCPNKTKAPEGYLWGSEAAREC